MKHLIMLASCFDTMEVYHVLNAVYHIIDLLAQFLFFIIVLIFHYSHILETIESPGFRGGASLDIVAPAHKTEIKNRSAESKVGKQLIGGTKIHSHTEAGKSETVIFDFAPLYLVGFGGSIIFRTYLLLCRNTESGTGSSV